MKRLLFFGKLFAATMMCIPFAAMAQVTIGSLEAPERAALLNLKSHAPDADNVTSGEGGLLLPRVELEDHHSLAPLIVNADANEKRNHIGLIVYNVTDDEPAELAPGFYYWDGGEWMPMLTEVPQNTANMRNLLTPTSASIRHVNNDTGTPLNFGTITVPKDGHYAFSFRLYGLVANEGGTGNLGNNLACLFYLKAFVDNTFYKSTTIGFSTAVLGTVTTNTVTYSITIVVDALEDQEISFKLAHDGTTPRQWTLSGVATQGMLSANRTSMVWWKL